MRFNDCQKRIIDMGVNHLLNPYGKQVFQYSGKAGTGKSVVMYEIFKQSGLKVSDILPMAYIGQAAIIMRLKGFPTAKTIHSSIYDVSLSPMYGTKNDYLNTINHGIIYNLKDLKNIKAIFIDEAGTVPSFLKEDIEANGIKIIAAGDANQLPPVMGNPAYLNPTDEIYFLDKVMRQREGSGILYIAEKALNMEPIDCGFYGDALVIYEDELTNDILNGADMVLCATNATRDRLTHLIRNEIRGIRSSLPRFGEKVICRGNDWSIEVNGIGLGNGLIGSVNDMPDVSSMDKDVFYMDFKPDLFDGVFYNLDVNYKYFTASSKEKNNIKKNPYLQGHLFDFAYVNTVHLTQGGSYRKVIYYEEQVFDRETQRRLNYTACTRATEALIYVKKRYNRYY